MPYLLDANVFMEAKNRHYGFDFCPAFWEWLLENNQAQRVFSIEKVGDEIAAGTDALAVWAGQRDAGFFLRPDDPVLPAFQQVSGWAMGQAYQPAAVTTFLQAADFYLVAHALAHSYNVVTHEVPRSGAKAKVKIPDVCIGLGVKCMTPFEMLRVERARFVLGEKVGGAK